MMKKKLFDENVTILENKKVNGKYYKLTFRSEPLSAKVCPGKFLQIRINDGQDPYLRRPFSYYRVTGTRVEILYEVLGRGTRSLSQKKKGDGLRIMGPLGNGFTAALGKKKRVLVAGGVGVPPLVYLAEKNPTDYLLIGTKSRLEVLPKAELKKVKAKILYSTEDGSCGSKGLVTALLEKIMTAEDPRELFIQTCGPKRMMQAVIALARKYGIDGEASWDESMACGVGACLGCMVKTKEGLKRACADGPVFRFEDLDV
ncbi:MAG TPA: dihydroorotate dehydrogenase electron transfer subunit [Candidatus Omnitrophota bacterium]|nr:dihydroorotate dehydrogenase electron transfer subunit [Candidatus Omnitrophota bacterium]HPS36496.1 dihydroorotate dehydrogenase electron transfer subunit [Candidatus Omnitrophota bacterium]